MKESDSELRIARLNDDGTPQLLDEEIPNSYNIFVTGRGNKGIQRTNLIYNI